MRHSARTNASPEALQSVRSTMHATRQLMGVFAAALVGSTLSAQTPASEIDAHVNAARTAAGLDYRATFVNLCFAGANPGLPNPAVARAGGAAPAGGRGAADGRGAGG